MRRLLRYEMSPKCGLHVSSLMPGVSVGGTVHTPCECLLERPFDLPVTAISLTSLRFCASTELRLMS